MNDVDAEMLKNLGLLLSYEELQNSSLWDDFLKNFDEIKNGSLTSNSVSEDEELTLESEGE